MSGSDDETTETWVPYSQRPEWADVTPVPEYPSAEVPPVCRIAYSDRFRETMDYFRAVLCAEEYSERALALSREVILCNQSNYTAWHYRRECLVALGAPAARWAAELELVERIAEMNPKNYQLWYHRQAVVRRTHDVAAELAFCTECVHFDSKNYHAWAHRQWLLETFADAALWAAELAYVDGLLARDVRNNSAWNQRFFVRTKTLPPGTTALPDALAAAEIDYAVPLIHKSPNNECPWNYMRGFVHHGPFPLFTFFLCCCSSQCFFVIVHRVAMKSESGSLLAFPKLKEVALEYRAKCPACPHCLALLADISDAEGNNAVRVEALTALRDTVDCIRRKYWQYLIDHPANPALLPTPSN